MSAWRGTHQSRPRRECLVDDHWFSDCPRRRSCARRPRASDIRSPNASTPRPRRNAGIADPEGAPLLHEGVSTADDSADKSRYAESRWSSRPIMRRIVGSSSLSLFFAIPDERSLDAPSHDEYVPSQKDAREEPKEDIPSDVEPTALGLRLR